MRFSRIKLFSVLIGSALLAACGGDDTTNVAEGGIGGTGMTVGTVTEVGSITVNGVKYSTKNARIVSDTVDQIDTTGQLINDESWMSVGMVAKVEGIVNADGVTGTASLVTYLDNVEGPLESNPVGNTFTVLGQVVDVNDLTQFSGGISVDANNQIIGLVANDVVNVSGYVDAAGVIHATYVEKKLTLGKVEIKGGVSSLSADSFIVNNTLTVNFSGATSTPDNLADGQFVEVEGDLNLGVLDADTVELFMLHDNDVDEAEFEGIVTTISGQTFVLNGMQTVDFSAAEFDGGTDLDLAIGIRLEAEGAIVNGTLQADSIEFRESIELAGIFDKVGNTLALQGTGIVVQVDESIAEINGIADFASIQNGDRIEVRARMGAAGTSTLVATRVDWKESLSTDMSLSIQGLLQDAVTGTGTIGTVTLLGETINIHDTQGNALLTLEREGDVPLSVVDFFADVLLNDGTINSDIIIEAEGSYDPLAIPALSWDKVELDE